MSQPLGVPLVNVIKSELFPIDHLYPDAYFEQVLARVLVTDFQQAALDPEPGGRFDIALTLDEELSVGLVGLEGVTLVLGGPSAQLITFGMEMRPTGWKSRLGAGARLRFPRDVLKPVCREGDKWTDDALRPFAEISLSVGMSIDENWDVAFDGSNSFRLDAAMIADSGLVIEGDIALDLSETTGLPESAALGLPPTWRGVVFKSLRVYLPEVVTDAVPLESLDFSNFHIGTGGVTGTISLTGTRPQGSIGGFPFRPTLFEVELQQNCLVRAELEGQITLSFFDEPLDVGVGFDLDGNFLVSLKTTTGIARIEKPGVLSLEVDSATFSHRDGVFGVGISGTITPLIAGVDWPSFALRELWIDSEGRLLLEGGWLDLPNQYSLDFHGFQIDITRLGLGSADDGGKWLGFSGSIKLVDGIGIGGSVDGLRICWYPNREPDVTLEGIDVELDVPETLRFKGAVSYSELGGEHRFAGAITLDLVALDLQLDGKIVIGQASGVNYFALYVDVELPAGIPLWATGLGLYGVAGLLAIQMAPARQEGEEWFENLDGTAGWYKRPDPGVNDLDNKWESVADGFALGGGVTIGTIADNGFTFNGAMLLVISFPGPVILLEGKANILAKRDNPDFRALAVLDFRAGEFLIGLMARYKFGDSGQLIDISGSSEVFFDFNDASRWHLYLGQKDPKERRIRAQILSIFESNSYFMLDARRLEMGAWVGYDAHWSFGPLSVTIEAWLEGGTIVSWRPVYFYGALWLHGRAGLSVFGFGFGMSVDARFAAEVFDPFHLLAEMSVGISLPWPLPDFSVGIKLEWGPEGEIPGLPGPLKEVAIEHFKTTVSWPLPRGNAEDGGPPAGAPVVPMDVRPHITFEHPVNDDALVGINPQPVSLWQQSDGWERIGNPQVDEGPMRVRYGLKEIALAEWNGSRWIDVARKTKTETESVGELWGSWAPTPMLAAGPVASETEEEGVVSETEAGGVAPGTDPPVANVKLWLWSKTPFDYTRHGGRAWDEWFTDTFKNYPCIPPVPEHTVCCDFDDLPAGTALALPAPCRKHREMLFVGSVDATVEQLPSPAHGHRQALCWQSEELVGDGRPLVPTGRTGAPRFGGFTPGPDGRKGAFGIVLAGPPAQRMTLMFAGHATIRHCIDVEAIDGETVSFPLTQDGTTLRIFDAGGNALPDARIVARDGERGFDIRKRAEVMLPCAASALDVTVWQFGEPARVTGYEGDGTPVDSSLALPVEGRATARLRRAGISRVVIDAPAKTAVVIEVCADCIVATSPDVRVIAIDTEGGRSGPYVPVGDTVTVEAANLRAVAVYGGGRLCLLQACVTLPRSADEYAARQDMAKRLSDSMALWGQKGRVLKPNTSFQLKIVTSVEEIGEGTLAGHHLSNDFTDFAYFKTQGPPGLAKLTPPVLQSADETEDADHAFDSGLDDLNRYVRQTIPATVPARGQQPVLPRPVYRAYDVGVEFNEDYVDLMYRLAHRDLNLYLYDVNSRPVRDVAGRVVVAANRWGTTESLSLTESEDRYLSVLDRVTCVTADPTIIPHQVTLSVVDPNLVLEPDTVHEARLVPMLLHEDFRDGIGAWTVLDAGTNQGPSEWKAVGHPDLAGDDATAEGALVKLPNGDLSLIEPAVDVVILATDAARLSKTYRIVSVDNANKAVTVDVTDGLPVLPTGSSAWRIPGWGAVVQQSNLWGGETVAKAVAKPGTMLVTGDAAWTDYRFSAQVRSSDDDAVGVVFRYQGPGDHYRFSMDRERAYRRLVRVAGGACTVLAEDDFVYISEQDYIVTVEAIGASIRIYQDGEPVFDAVDAALRTGGIGLYCWASEGARFSDVRVDDLRANAPITYRFPFTTSKYADFFHHLHSFQDEVWVTAVRDADLASEIAAAVDPAAALGDAEARGYALFAEKVLGTAARGPVDAVEVHRITVDGTAIGLLLRSPEPIEWKRTALDISYAPGLADAPTVPRVVKLVDVACGGASPNDEVITLLARERTSLACASIEVYDIPGPLREMPTDVMLDETFDRPGGVLLEQVFGANALDGFRTLDLAGYAADPTQWAATDNAIIHLPDTRPLSGAELGTPESAAVTGQQWSNIRLTVVVRSGSPNAIGAVFRFKDDRNWVRFSMDHQLPYRSLVTCVDGTATILWTDHYRYDTGRAYEVCIEAFNDLLVGHVDHELVFVVRDPAIREGQVGLCAGALTDARFEALRVESLETSPLLWQVPLASLAELTIVDSGTVGGPSVWTAASGQAIQTGDIGGDVAPLGIARPGTVALLERSFDDFRFSTRLGAVLAGAMGVVFRYQDAENWYRFSIDRDLRYQRLVCCASGSLTVLWQEALRDVSTSAHRYGLTVSAEGPRLRGWLDGTQLFDVLDHALRDGLNNAHPAWTPRRTA